jgi:hypothetical protein
MEKEKGELDWSILKGAMIMFCICLVFGTSLIVWGYYFNTKHSKELSQNKRIFQSISRQYLDVDQEEKLLQEYFPQFVTLYNRGVIGREKRLNWIEALRQSGEKINLPSLRYSISSQEEFIPEFVVNYSGYTIYSSSMELSLGLMHEGDLFELLNYIDEHAEGAYTLSECAFNKNGNEIKFEKNYANIAVTCLVNWLTLDVAGGNRIEI